MIAAKKNSEKDYLVWNADSAKSISNMVICNNSRQHYSKNISLLKKDGQMTSTPEEYLESLLSTHLIRSKKLHEHSDNTQLMSLDLSE